MSTLDKNDTVTTTHAAPAQAPTAPSADPRRALAERFTRLPAEKQRGFLQALKAQGIDFAMLPIVPAPLEARPLSFAQLRQWFLWTLDRTSTAYHLSGALTLEGEVDAAAMRDSFAALVARHESLRTTFHADAQGQVVQRVHAAGDIGFALEMVDLREDEGSDALDTRTRAEVRRLVDTPFDLERGPLLRVALLREGARRQVLVVVMHHIVSDAWSMKVIVDEFIAQYGARVRAETPSMAALPIQYADYAAWQRHWLEAGERERQLAYWVAQLGGEQPVLQLPTDRPRRPDGRYRAAQHGVELPEALVTATGHRQGLVVIASPAGHGKSTTLAALVDHLNATTALHVVTVEDPIEYLHPRKKAMLSQREVGTHVQSFAAGLRDALREDPDLILIGEMRDRDSAALALTAAETGHLVLSSLHCRNATSAVARIVDLFPAEQQAQVRAQLADSLRAEGVPVFGPSQAAAQLEGSKGFTKDLCQRAGIPTAGYVRTTSLAEARAALEKPATVDEIRNSLSEAGVADVESVKIQQVENPDFGENVFQIQGTIPIDQVVCANADGGEAERKLKLKREVGEKDFYKEKGF